MNIEIQAKIDSRHQETLHDIKKNYYRAIKLPFSKNGNARTVFRNLNRSTLIIPLRLLNSLVSNILCLD